jgi:hypothetical protein
MREGVLYEDQDFVLDNSLLPDRLIDKEVLWLRPHVSFIIAIISFSSF